MQELEVIGLTLFPNKYVNNNLRFPLYAGDNMLDQLSYKKENNSISVLKISRSAVIYTKKKIIKTFTWKYYISD